MRLLLVEDDMMIGEAIRAGLKREGFTVDWVHDGESAAQVLRTEAFDLLLLDLGLPRRGGLEVLTAARARGHAGNQRLHNRWVSLNLRKKRSVIANVAVARELAGWCWSLAVLPD